MRAKPVRVPRKRGTPKHLPPMVDTHVFMPIELLEWAKRQPEGFAPLMRTLLAQEYDKRCTATAVAIMHGAPPG